MPGEADSRAIAANVLARAARAGVTVHHKPRYVAAAIASEPDPFSLLDEPPPLRDILAGMLPRPVRPQSCGQCHPVTRMRENPETGQPSRCPDCHPNAQEAS